MKLGVVGLPNVGKSTLFNAITNAGAQCANYPFCTIEPNVGVVEVPDYRLDVLSKMYNPKRVVPAMLEFVDIAGLVKGASCGEGLGNKFLSHIREVDAIVHVVRCFEDENIVHVSSNVSPLDDIDVINTELYLADIESVAKRRARFEKALKGDKKYQTALDILDKMEAALNNGKSVLSLGLTAEQLKEVDGQFLLSVKPVIYCANISEKNIGKPNPLSEAVMCYAKAQNSEFVQICAKAEEEIAGLEKQEQAEFIEALGLEAGGLDTIVKKGYALLNLISFLTAGPKEVRAWTIERGTTAPAAAGKIHTDFERGFIKAEIVAYPDLVSCGSVPAAREKGKLRLEGRDYIMKDGDVVEFRFNV